MKQKFTVHCESINSGLCCMQIEAIDGWTKNGKKKKKKKKKRGTNKKTKQKLKTSSHRELLIVADLHL